jgi:uncharacterized protein (DUF488 family)
MTTIGHSTLSLEAFLRALKEADVRTLVDVRRFPGSRRHPQFGQKALFEALEAEGSGRSGGRVWVGAGLRRKTA